MSCCLLCDKLSSLKVAISDWLSRRKCTERDLLSLIGSLSFACRVVKPGRIFLRRLIDLSTRAAKLHHHLDISKSVRDDLSMWSSLLESWNGVSVFQSLQCSSFDLHLYTDASFKGLGAFLVASGFLLLGYATSLTITFRF